MQCGHVVQCWWFRTRGTNRTTPIALPGLGIARALNKSRYTPQRAAAELSRLLDDPA
jgi:hypothetical protein